MGVIYAFMVEGHPEPMGSKKAFPIRRMDGSMGVAVTDANKHGKGWQHLVREEACKHATGPLLDSPLKVTYQFFLRRPAGHYRTGKNSHLLKDDAPKYPHKKPDATKLVRGTEDALKGLLWIDDGQTVSQYNSKNYVDRTEREGVFITIERME